MALTLACLGLAGLLAVPAWAQTTGNSSGLPLPRFVTTRSEPINVRVGPGTKYEIAWVFVKAGIPVEIIAEFDTWRKIRDSDGQEGWVHQNLLAGRRAGYVAPWKAAAPGEADSEARIALLSRKAADSGVRAYLGPGYRIQIASCDGDWCAVSATHTPETGRAATYSGFLAQSLIWGVYAGEIFD